MNQKIQRAGDMDAFDLSRRSNDLVAFVENLLQEVKPPATVVKERAPPDNKSFSVTISFVLVSNEIPKTHEIRILIITFNSVVF